jgi:hypothetical protein
MAITNRTRKLLWGGAGSRCAFCRAKLVAEATPLDREALVGEECHIVSGSPDGPRYDPDFPSDEIDSYSSLILLCRVHPKTVDDQPETFTAEILAQWKENHIRWVSHSLDAAAWSADVLSTDPTVAAFQKVKSEMPGLIAEMRADLSREGDESVREFYLAKKTWKVNWSDPCFAYYYEDHPSLGSEIKILENYGFVVDISTGQNLKACRMMEAFVELLLID